MFALGLQRGRSAHTLAENEETTVLRFLKLARAGYIRQCRDIFLELLKGFVLHRRQVRNVLQVLYVFLP